MSSIHAQPGFFGHRKKILHQGLADWARMITSNFFSKAMEKAHEFGPKQKTLKEVGKILGFFPIEIAFRSLRPGDLDMYKCLLIF